MFPCVRIVPRVGEAYGGRALGGGRADTAVFPSARFPWYNPGRRLGPGEPCENGAERRGREPMSRAVERDGNVVGVRGSIGPEATPMLCAALHQAHGDDHTHVVLDFSRCDGITQAVMLPLMPLVTQWRELRDVRFELVPPLEPTLARLFVNANWASHIDPDRHGPNTHRGGHVPALRFLDDGGDGQDAILGRVMELILGSLDTAPDTLKAVEWSLGEIMDNVNAHAKSPVGEFVQATAFAKSNVVEFVVADSGIGIPASFGAADNEEALRMAITEGVTRDRTRNAGNGLFGSYRVAVESAGTFEIRSGWALLRRAGKGKLHTSIASAPYEGTSVRCRIGVADPGVLHRALRFGGRPHDPPYDFVEREFEGERGEIVFNMRDKASPHFGSRRGGARVRRMVTNLLRTQRSIVLDFEGVGVFTSSFADEVFGRLFVAMGPRAFMARIRMVHVDPTVDGLIDRAIVQRTRLAAEGAAPS